MLTLHSHAPWYHAKPTSHERLAMQCLHNIKSQRPSSSSPLLPPLPLNLPKFHLRQLHRHIRNITPHPPSSQRHTPWLKQPLRLSPPLPPQPLLSAHAVSRTTERRIAVPSAGVPVSSLTSGTRERVGWDVAPSGRRRWGRCPGGRLRATETVDGLL